MAMSMKKVVAALVYWGACEEAIEWLKKQKTPKQAWEKCSRGEWLGFLLDTIVPTRRRELMAQMVFEATYDSFPIIDTYSGRKVRKHISWRVVRPYLKSFVKKYDGK